MIVTCFLRFRSTKLNIFFTVQKGWVLIKIKWASGYLSLWGQTWDISVCIIYTITKFWKWKGAKKGPLISQKLKKKKRHRGVKWLVTAELVADRMKLYHLPNLVLNIHYNWAMTPSVIFLELIFITSNFQNYVKFMILTAHIFF